MVAGISQSTRVAVILLAILFVGIQATGSNFGNKENKIGSSSVSKKKLHIGALIPFMLTHDQFSFHAAMQTAVRLINIDDTILKDYELTISYNDSTTLVGFSYLTFYYLVEREPIKQILIGPAFARATRAVAELSTRFCIPQITYSTLQKFERAENVHPIPELELTRIQKEFPFMVKATPSLVSFNEANVKLLQHFKWERVAILYEYSAQQFFSTAYDLSIRLKEAGINPIVIQGFSAEFLTVDSQLQTILDNDIRIIFGSFGNSGARRIFCEAYHRNMTRPKYQWVTVSTLQPDWWEPVHYKEAQNCSTYQYLAASDGYMTTSKTSLRRDNTKTVGGLSSKQSWDLVVDQKTKDYHQYWEDRKAGETVPDITKELLQDSMFAFDAVYLAAKTLDAVIKEKGEDGLMTRYYDKEKALHITETMLKANFEAVTGKMYYGGESGEERLGEITIQQFKANSSNSSQLHAELNPIGYYNIEKKSMEFYEQDDSKYFQGNRVVKDRKTINRIPRYYSVTMIAILWGLVSAGLVLSFSVLFINIRYRRIRMIKMSSPNINNGIIAGSIICYASVIVYGLDARFLSKYGIQIACNAVTVTLSIGFTLSFGCLFSKTWRIYKIFTAAKTMEKVSIKDAHLYGIIFLLVGIDVFVFLLWIGISPFSVVEVELEQLPYPDEDMVDSFFYYKCSCKYQLHFTVATYCYKGFLLIFGLFLAWETRNVKVAVLNDSKYIGMAVYNVCVVSAVGVICASALYNTAHYSTGYLVVTISIFLCTTGILLLIFVPKIYMLFGKSFNVTYGNVSVRTFTSSTRSNSVMKNAASNRHSAVVNEGQSETSLYEKHSSFKFMHGTSDIYSPTRCMKLTSKDSNGYILGSAGNP